MINQSIIRDFIRDRYSCEKTGVVVFEASPGDHYCYAHLERVLMDFEAWKKNRKRDKE